jgi:SAM-dependent methyltransferase
MIKYSDNGNDTFRLEIAEMPWWHGAQEKKTVPDLVPFAIESKKTEPIKQYLSEPDKAKLINIYQKDEYQFITAPPGESDWSNRLAIDNVARFENEIVLNFDTNVLEIGGGSTWLAHFIRENFGVTQYTCIDPAIRAGTCEFPHLIRDYFPSTKLENKKFDLILAFNVLEHVESADDFLASVRNSLKDDGQAVICVPDCTNQFKVGDINSLIHEHVIYLTDKSVRQLFEKNGFFIVKVTSKHDLFTVIVRKNLSADKHFHNFDDLEYLKLHAKNLDTLINECASLIKKHIQQGSRVGFHGATQGLNSFLHMSGLKEFPVYIFDGDKRKHGLYMPINNNPILSTTDDAYKMVDLMVVSALSFESEITGFIRDNTNLKDNQIVPMSASSVPMLL